MTVTKEDLMILEARELFTAEVEAKVAKHKQEEELRRIQREKDIQSGKLRIHYRVFPGLEFLD